MQKRRNVLRVATAQLPTSRARAHRVEAELTTSLPGIADRILDATLSVKQIALSVLVEATAFGVDEESINQARMRLG
jgi:hypothetical protein